MTYSREPDDVDPSIRLIVAATLRRISQRQIHPQDRRDATQHLLLRVLEAGRKYDPARGAPEAYAAVVARTALANYLRTQSASKRACRRTSGGTDRLRFVTDPRSHRERESVDLALDVADVLGRLPLDLRELAEELTRGTVSDAARVLGQHRTTVYSRLAALRRAFDNAGLRPSP